MGPSKDVVPTLTGEGASNDDVLHGLLGLVTQGTTIIVRQAMMSESSRRPAAVEVSEPSEYLDAEGSPTSPCKAP